MTSSLVGSEMCIRDRYQWSALRSLWAAIDPVLVRPLPIVDDQGLHPDSCLLYTSDAADDM
eukprot:8634345-Prorocentrum_lima.AAC.1